MIDPARAFALMSVFFYVAFVAAAYRLAQLAAPTRPWVATAAGLYLAFAPAFVTRYSLSNDGNYVEVLALGTWALVLAARWLDANDPPPTASAAAAGILLGLAFWCHILAAIHIATVGIALIASARLKTLKPAAAFMGGLILGDFPALLWNATNGWESFRYLAGAEHVGAVDEGPGLLGRIIALLSDHLPVLLGYDPGYSKPIDVLFRIAAWLAVALVVLATASSIRTAIRERNGALRVLLLLSAINIAVAVAALPAIPGNPRYLLFLMAAIPVLLARALDAGSSRLERRLERLGVTYERRDLMKPVLLRLSRKVDPSELFPDREFPWR